MSTERTERLGHRDAWEVLPWYVNGSLDGNELDRFEAHLAACESCRAEVEIEERWAREIRASEELVYSPDRAFAALEGRIAASRSAARTSAGWTRWWRSGRGEEPTSVSGAARAGHAGFLRWLVAAQAAAILILVGALWLEPEPTEFHTVSDVASEGSLAATGVRVVFEDGLDEAELRRLLHESGARIVDGPSPRGVYSLEIEEDRLDAALERLRSHPGVRLAEPF